MKKEIKKLEINKQSITVLSDNSKNQVVGGSSVLNGGCVNSTYCTATRRCQPM
jgi:hypothetical protein